ncbi:hypothetical protein [Paenibacillus spongiae]|uniref:Uncharacterized protein n=1 Tax=Paenibacillus spongiae TaxID=2909671 RepID=A0ABY5SGR3_9BACL|nr:hypothetical protein [Paenibacillus spongiae]UVI33174.1 hypothetical protein L1F29_15615 [Paenibacillus spongiae]
MSFVEAGLNRNSMSAPLTTTSSAITSRRPTDCLCPSIPAMHAAIGEQPVDENTYMPDCVSDDLSAF